MNNMDIENSEPLTNQSSLKIQGPSVFENVEWAFQFNDDDPVAFAWSTTDPKKLDISISNTSDSNIIFHDNKGNKFKIFARERISG